LFQQFVPAATSFENISTMTWIKRRHYLAAFMVFDIDFWFQPLVQHYVKWIMSTGLDMQQRWLEQGTTNMVRLLFIPNNNLFAFNANIIHSYFVHHDTIFRRFFGCAAIVQNNTVANNEKADSRLWQYNGSIPIAPQDAVSFIIHYTRENLIGTETVFALMHFNWTRSDYLPTCAAASPQEEKSFNAAYSAVPTDVYGPRGLYSALGGLIAYVDYYCWNKDRRLPPVFCQNIRTHASQLFKAQAMPQHVQFMQLVHRDVMTTIDS
jgi:hypothetical protein